MFDRTDCDLILAKLFELTWNDFVTAISHIVTHYYAASHQVAWSVGLSVALPVCHTSEPCKTAETIKLPSSFRTRVGPMNHILHELQMPTWKGQFWRGKQANHCKVCMYTRRGHLCKDDWTDQGAIWVMDSHGPKASCVTCNGRLCPVFFVVLILSCVLCC